MWTFVERKEVVDKRSQKKVRTSKEEPCQYFESERLQRCDLKCESKEIELKSLILAQIERWRHALHMQVERQHRELAPGWRVAHG